eukprot:gb/GFBE01078885.1/.p1 GENE.gb/GFBE01078885.1/~~gb/GFBE01078885.1/.p1  ORF type:complete len:619 (+),score=95.08 gb/GFBE01078885.1/:1-1857(+)
MIRTSSERLHTSSQHGGPLRATLSSVSLTSSCLFTETLASRRSGRSYSASPTPKSAGHGRNSSPRRFSSRHVPKAAEELAAQSQVLSPQVVTRFDGLMKHLKRNTDKQDFEKQVLASPPEVLVPEEYDEVLRGEFERRCSFGERLNTELMHSGKWVKLLRDLGLVRTDAKRGPCLSSLAEADIIFRRVLHDSDYGGKRLTYDYFCKALCLVAANVYPDLDWEEAMGKLLERIAAAAEEAESQSTTEPIPDFSLDPNVVLVLDHFKAALHDLFRSFARRQLPGPTDARQGAGTTRLRERSIWKHTQDTMFASRASTFAGGYGREDRLDSDQSPYFGPAVPGFESQGQDEDSQTVLPAVQECTESEKGESVSPQKPVNMPNSEADAGGGYAEAPMSSPRSSPRREQKPGRPSLPSASMLGQASSSGPSSPGPNGGSGNGSPSVLAWAQNRGWCSPGRTTSSMATGSRFGTWSPSSADPYTYANGSPIIKNRRSFMSLEQIMSLCKELKIVPDLVSRQSLVRIFKRVQCAGSASSHGGSNFGFLSQEAFVDAMGQIAVEAYTQEPYCDEYPSPHEKIHAFLSTKLPGHARTMRDRFLYGCSGRGPPVQPGFIGTVVSSTSR